MKPEAQKGLDAVREAADTYKGPVFGPIVRSRLALAEALAEIANLGHNRANMLKRRDTCPGCIAERALEQIGKEER